MHTGKFFRKKKGGTWHNKEVGTDRFSPGKIIVFGNGKKNSFYGSDSRQLRKVITDLRELPFDIPL
ncbi:MAG: hypothetical protein OQK82_02915 [Candidatus Pacearchaeota archaeon]|nr:hypothetical protein [Candidatus Pacearchaeota archaeon]